MIMLFWLEFMLLPVLVTGPTLLVMDLFKSHSTQEIKDWLHAHRIVPSLVPGGCTGLVQPLDVLVNCPFKDILKQVIDDAVDLAERQPIPASTTGKKDWQSEASKMSYDDKVCGQGLGDLQPGETRCYYPEFSMSGYCSSN